MTYIVGTSADWKKLSWTLFEFVKEQFNIGYLYNPYEHCKWGSWNMFLFRNTPVFLWYLHKRTVKSLLLFLLLVLYDMDLHVSPEQMDIYTNI